MKKRSPSKCTVSLSLHRRSRRATGCVRSLLAQESRAIIRKPRDATAVVFGLNFADNIHYKFKSNQVLKARLQSSKRTGAKQNLTQNGHSTSFEVTCFGVSGKEIRD